jgi:hypothetical protein
MKTKQNTSKIQILCITLCFFLGMKFCQNAKNEIQAVTLTKANFWNFLREIVKKQEFWTRFAKFRTPTLQVAKHNHLRNKILPALASFNANLAFLGC